MKKIRVLIVEDEFIIFDILCDELEEIGYEIVGGVMKVQEVLEILEQGDIDIVILDIYLKGSEFGIWLVKQICKCY